MPMLWTWILIGAWLGSILGFLILVLGILFSGRRLPRVEKIPHEP
jgi:hypothetical protein